MAYIFSGSTWGVDGHLHQVRFTPGGDHNRVIGLSETAAREALVRVRCAVQAGNFTLRVGTYQLDPMPQVATGTQHDLALLLALLVGTDQVQLPGAWEGLVIGELSLDGAVRPVRGVLPIAQAAAARGGRIVHTCCVPRDNGNEACAACGISVYGIDHLNSLIQLLQHGVPVRPIAPPPEQAPRSAVDLSEVRGQESAKRALEIAITGGHHLLFIGPPGAGKAMLARRATTLLPTMSFEECLETTRIYSVAGLLQPGELLRTNRPFRAPHHTISSVALLGGGSTPRPGEISLAHNGVLFLDELPEFRRDGLEVLRQPLEEHQVTLAPSKGILQFPANFQLIAATNPCPCGHRGSDVHECRCTTPEVARYLRRFSSTLGRRLDLAVVVPPVPFDTLHDRRPGESSAAVRDRIQRGRERAAKFPQLSWQPGARRVLHQAQDRYEFTDRRWAMIENVAHTIACLEQQSEIAPEHVAEALAFYEPLRDIHPNL